MEHKFIDTTRPCKGLSPSPPELCSKKILSITARSPYHTACAEYVSLIVSECRGNGVQKRCRQLLFFCHWHSNSSITINIFLKIISAFLLNPRGSPGTPFHPAGLPQHLLPFPRNCRLPLNPRDPRHHIPEQLSMTITRIRWFLSRIVDSAILFYHFRPSVVHCRYCV